MKAKPTHKKKKASPGRRAGRAMTYDELTAAVFAADMKRGSAEERVKILEAGLRWIADRCSLDVRQGVKVFGWEEIKPEPPLMPADAAAEIARRVLRSHAWRPRKRKDTTRRRPAGATKARKPAPVQLTASWVDELAPFPKPERVVIKIDPECVALLAKPAEGPGGFQGLVRRLQRARVGKDWLALDAKTVERLQRYASKYGDGGFERRFRSVLSQLRGLAKPAHA